MYNKIFKKLKDELFIQKMSSSSHYELKSNLKISNNYVLCFVLKTEEQIISENTEMYIVVLIDDLDICLQRVQFSKDRRDFITEILMLILLNCSHRVA